METAETRDRDSPPVSACRDRRPLISLLLSAVHRSCPPAPGISLGRPGWSLRVGGHSGVVVHTALDQDGADGGDANAAHTPSPVCLNNQPPWRSIASCNTLSWAASACRIPSASASHRRVEPSISVNRNVTTPEGGPPADTRTGCHTKPTTTQQTATDFRDSRMSSISRPRSVLLAPGRFGRMRRSPWRRWSSFHPCGRAIRRSGRRGHRAGG